ncbi:MAG: beta-lactamase family protein [Acidobacteriota bacterium]|nr:beta-lactamase family protein [Acidobacteriota bacterium]
MRRTDTRGLFLALPLTILLAATPGCRRHELPEVTLRGDPFDRVRSLIEETFHKHDVASVAIAAARDGRIVWEEAFGWSDRDERVAATPDSIYALASISKSFTATGLMVLVERGLVELDRPINEYLGGAKLVSYVGDAEEVTVRQVLEHTAGLPMHHNIFFRSRTARPPDQDESIRRYGIIVGPPGREYVYSNFGYGLLDRVISTVSGRSYAEFMAEELFGPLGLTHTSVLANPSLRAQTVTHYDVAGGIVPPLDFDHRGASAVHSSVHDLIRYGMFHLHNEVSAQGPILSLQTIDMMHEPSEITLAAETEAEVRSGLGWAVVDVAGERFLVASGGMPGTTTRLALVPERNAAVALAFNSGGGAAADYSPWRIEWETFAALIPEFPEAPEIDAEVPHRTPLPERLRGDWAGSIKTYEGDVEAALTIRRYPRIVLAIDGKEAGPIGGSNPLGRLSFEDGVLEGPFFGSIPSSDCRRSNHVVFLRLREVGDSLGGVAACVAMDRSFWLPHWMELKKVGATGDRHHSEEESGSAFLKRAEKERHAAG